jgi:pimeloyl-ACP methyl ester carboxylesterase
MTESITVGRQKLRVKRTGTGKPLLLIMGLGGCIESWKPLQRQLTGRELIMVDHPGMGHSPAPALVLPMPQIAKMYVGLLDKLGYDCVDVLGYSFGGTVAQQMAVQHPDRIDRLVLAATACGWGGVPMSLSAALASAIPMRYYSETFREGVAPYLYAGRSGREPSRLAAEVVPKPTARGLMFQIAAYSMWTSLPWLHKIPHRTLVMAGEEDPMAPAKNSVLLARRIPNASLHMVQRGGHLFLFDETERVVPVLREFFDDGEQVSEAV